VKEPRTNIRDVSNNLEVKLLQQLEKPNQELPNSNNSHVEVKYELSMNNICSCGSKGIEK
jgi:hypothetical protein